MTIRFIPIGMQQANLHLSVDPRSNPKAIPSPLAIVVEFKKLPLYRISVTSLNAGFIEKTFICKFVKLGLIEIKGQIVLFVIEIAVFFH